LLSASADLLISASAETSMAGRIQRMMPPAALRSAPGITLADTHPGSVGFAGDPRTTGVPTDSSRGYATMANPYLYG